jgi:UDP-glucose 4-epimerase
MNILITGGAGFIGSHLAFKLSKAGHKVIIFDNDNTKSPKFDYSNVVEFTGDIRNIKDLLNIFANVHIDLVIHTAALKSLPESVNSPLDYYDVNVAGTINLLKVMKKYNCKKLIFSSSAAIYGDIRGKVRENEDYKEVTNPYGKSKKFVEQILEDLHTSDSSWKIAILRYFNPAGYVKGLTEPKGNLFYYIKQVAHGDLPYLPIFGNEHCTSDGTTIRDYIHILDLVDAHLILIDKFSKINGVDTFNIGSGKGSSVFQVVETYQKVNSVKIPYIIEAPRDEIEMILADITKFKRKFGWKPIRNLEDICKDSY